MIPDDGLQLEETLEGVFVEREFLVAEPEVVEGLHARRVVLQGHVVQLTRLLHVALLKGAIRWGKNHCNQMKTPNAFQLRVSLGSLGWCHYQFCTDCAFHGGLALTLDSWPM